VIACASPAKLSVARTMGGADFVVDYTCDGWQKEVLKITGGRGVDVVYDPVGRIKGTIHTETPQLTPPVHVMFLADALKCTVWGGRALVVGFAGGEIEKVSVVTLSDEHSMGLSRAFIATT